MKIEDNDVIKNYLIEMAKVFPIEWDRYTEDNGEWNIYGWIKRKDGQRDFVLLQFIFENDAIEGGFVTSSAKHSAKISEYMFGSSINHSPCIKVPDLKIG